MRIDHLHVTNFRNFADCRFEFNPHFTVVIGVNGRGKSSILHALRIAAGSYLLGIKSATKRHIQEDEVRQIPTPTGHSIIPAPGDVIIEAEGEIEGEPLTWRRRRPEGGKKTTSSWDDVGLVRTKGELNYARIHEQHREDVDNPVIAFFGTGRYWAPTRNRPPKFPGKQILRDGYYDWADLKASSFKYESWRAAYSKLLADKREAKGLDQAFDEAILQAVPYVRKLDFDSEYGLWIKPEVDGVEYPYLPLIYQSDGFRIMIKMVAELAYRCVTLNGHHGRDAVRESRGLVLIDALDLHLHPNWQRHVVADLKRAFPKIQFVATTHSPFIVQSLAADEVLNLDGPGPDVDPSDLRIDKVAANVMGVESPYSEESEREEKAATEALQSPTADREGLPISNPALRAILRLEMLAKQAERDATD